jgi:hypothetical protein
MFLANCCLVMANLTFSAISGITLLFLLILGMILIPSEWVSSYCVAHNRVLHDDWKTSGNWPNKWLDKDLGQKVKILNFLIWYDESTDGKFFFSSGKIKRKNLCTFTRKEKISLIKIACFMLNFLNLKSKASHLFGGVASSLSILWS